MLTDLDGNRFYDLTGSYGVNVFGYDFYKECMDKGYERVRELGPVLGSYHPVVAYNVERLREISGLDEVSFHMSGTEAVMQAVRLARYHTRRTHLVRFSGAYHGWWGDVQPGVGNPLPARETYTLADMSEATLHVLRTRSDIACVLVNPSQAMHPNAGPAADSGLVDSSRSAGFDKEAYGAWLKQLRAVCSERGIVLIFDEIFLGFRLAPGGAQEYFGVRADLVTYGKTVGGGLPIGVVCGRRQFMKRYRDDRPVDVCFARGTFNSHPCVMGAMHEFLTRLDTSQMRKLYDNLDAVWDDRAHRLNLRFEAEGLPVRVANMSTVWTVCYDKPSRYNWMLQYYLRAEGLALSWIGTGRIIFSLNYTEADFEAVADRFVAAAKAMHGDGWWWLDAASHTRPIKRQILREMVDPPALRPPTRHRLASRLRRPSRLPLGLEVVVQQLVVLPAVARVPHRIDQLAPHQVERRLVVELDVVERVGDDLGHPHEAGLDVLEEEQMHGAEQQPAEADRQPHQRDVVHELGRAGVRLEDAEQGRVEVERERR